MLVVVVFLGGKGGGENWGCGGPLLFLYTLYVRTYENCVKEKFTPVLSFFAFDIYFSLFFLNFLIFLFCTLLLVNWSVVVIFWSLA